MRWPKTFWSAEEQGMLRFIIKTIMALVFLFVATVALLWWQFRPATPDGFYDQAVATGQPPGTLLKQEDFTRGIPEGTKAWRILYATTRHDNAPAVASAIVVVPINTSKPLPVIAWAHGTTGVARGCAPSLFANPFPYVPAFPDMFKQGWAYVGTDYVGQGTQGFHAYLVGDDAARNVLDSLRAVRQLKDQSWDSRSLVWGHSQGGHSALWTGLRAASYAPELDIVGIAALAPASDLTGLLREGRKLPFGKIVSAYVIESYAKSYPDVAAADLAAPWSRFLAADMASRCVGGWETLLSAVQAKLAPDEGLFRANALDGPFAARLRENTPTAMIPAPLFVAQGEADDLVFPSVQLNYVKARCAAGQALDYRSYAQRDHLSLVAPDSALTADLLAWSKDRLAGKPATKNCPAP
jgi:acetyl esterase/lipase